MSTQRGLPEQHYYYHNNQQVAGVSAPEAEVYRRINHKENGEPCEIRLPRVVSSRRPEPSVRSEENSCPSRPAFMRCHVNLQIPNKEKRPESKSETQRLQITRRQFDTFGESAIERIYDEFRFLDLDECHSPSSNSERPILRNDERTVTKKKGRRISAWVAAYCVLPAVQFVVSGAFLAFAIYRYYDLFKDRQISNIFLDLGKPEDFAGSPEEGAQINQILHIVFSCLSVLLWFSALNTSAVELNLQYVQIHKSENSSDHLIFVILICLAYFEVLLLPTITICLSSINLLVPKRHGKGAILTVSLSIATVLLAATILVFSIYAMSRSMWNIHDWPSTNIVNPGALFGFGLIESIIAGYILVCSFVSFLSSTMRSTHLSAAALILQGLSTVSICMYILSPDRILSVSHNAQVQSTERKPFPVNHVVSDQLIFVILICLAYFEVLLLPTITICLSSINLLVQGAILTVSQSIATVLLAATILVFSIYATSRSMWNIHDWPSTNIVNPGALFGFGLIESIIAGYILVCSFVSFLSSTMRSTHLSAAALILQGLSTVSICMYILSPDRILSVSHNAQVQSTERKPFPVNHVVMILLYSLVLALLVSLLMQIFTTIMIITKPERSTQESDEETNTTQQTLF